MIIVTRRLTARLPVSTTGENGLNLKIPQFPDDQLDRNAVLEKNHGVGEVVVDRDIFIAPVMK